MQAAELPNSLTLLPSPPRPGSAEHAVDLEVHKAAQALARTPRWRLAYQDTMLKFPAAASALACAAQMPSSEAETPHLNMLLRRTLADAGLATYKAKDHCNRARPFMALAAASCSPEEERTLQKDGSYPSGHAAVGWARGLLLAELMPERADAILLRSRQFGDSRAVCGVHWQSDIQAGRLVGAATLARLHANATFVAQMRAAQAEVTAQREKGAKPRQDCGAEARDLGS